MNFFKLRVPARKGRGRRAERSRKEAREREGRRERRVYTVLRNSRDARGVAGYDVSSCCGDVCLY